MLCRLYERSVLELHLGASSVALVGWRSTLRVNQVRRAPLFEQLISNPTASTQPREPPADPGRPPAHARRRLESR